ncbi:glycosyltransferase family 39 protein [Pseudarthrobacter sp. J1738]|uniref:glycosyltransferase family 39 protein n=1 Tax=Pseudarthrobacter sp. J1738 TaxID=3420446 RepID=UPI003D289E83
MTATISPKTPAEQRALAKTQRQNQLVYGGQARWIRTSAALLLLATAVLYLWNLGATGYGNSFYAAAIQSGTKNWTALLFGSLDPGNAITVDKPPASLWIPALSGRIFGFNSWSMLVPEALMGVAAVGFLYLTVKRVSGPAAGLIAGGALALTPVAALMFRFNNPDAMLTLCLVLAAYFTTRAIEKAGWKWLVAAGAIIGLAFLTKMLQGFLIVPGLALAYLWAAPTTLGKRILHLLGAAAGIVAVAGSYLLLFTLTPTSIRPYMAGSSNNSFLELTFGYNGLGRITGNEGGGSGGMSGGMPGGGMGGGNSSFGGATGILRMFGNSFGTEVSWLLPAALLLLVAGLWFTRKAIRTSRTRAALLMWGGWLVVTAGIFSFMSGIVHPYYAVALAPAIAAVVGIGATELWRGRAYWPARIVLAVAVAGTSVWGAILLMSDAAWLPWLRIVTVVLGVLAALALLFRVDEIQLKKGGAGQAAGRNLGGRSLSGRSLSGAVIALCLLAGGLSTGAWTLATAATPHSGSIPVSGPASTTSVRGLGGGAMQGGMGGEGAADAEVTALLKSTNTKWSAIVSGATQAASLELASDTSVIALGGWNGSDPYPTLAQFQQMVEDGQIGYFISGGMGGGPGGGAGGGAGGGMGGSSEVASWVAANFTAQTVGNSTVYKLTK